jgi:serine/threonine protein kinase
MTSTFENILETGQVLSDKWVILELIGKGGMGEVYRAHQLNLKRDVAIKVISQDWLRSLEGDAEEIETGLQRFRREVQAMARVRHPNVLQIYDYGSTSVRKNGDEYPVEYIVMEYVPGATLRFTLSEEGLYPDAKEVKDWLHDYFLPVLDGVQAIHDQDVVHRDLKPENVLLDGVTPKIADFGLARSTRMRPVTQSVDIKGTMPYMSPEHFLDFKNADKRADIYSLGKILFQAVEGRIGPDSIPFKQASLSKADSPFFEKLDRIIQGATAEDRNERVDSVEKLRIALLEVLSIKEADEAEPKTAAVLPPVVRLKWIWMGLVAVAMVMLAMIGYHFATRSEKPPLGSETGQKIPSPGPAGSSESGPLSPSTLPESILSEDGMTMSLLPSGILKPEPGNREGRSGEVAVNGFYLDKTPITNHHFTEFLNEVKETVTVVEDAVKGENGEIWLYLGDGTDPREQIVYRHDRFLLRDPRYAAQPVVRVTWYGARAYARHFGKRLPTEDEWSYAVQKGLISEGISGSEGNKQLSEGENSSSMSKQMSEMMRMMEPQENRTKSNQRATSAGGPVPGKIDMDGKVKEWVVRTEGVSGAETGSEKVSYPSLVLWISPGPGGERISKGFRYPWEGFIDVRFRCALNAETRN